MSTCEPARCHCVHSCIWHRHCLAHGLQKKSAHKHTSGSPAPFAMGKVKGSDAWLEAVSGSIGSIIALVATFPLKNIYTYQALDGGGQALSVLQVIKKYKLGGLYVGLEPNIVESAASSGVYFYLYSLLRDWAVRHKRKQAAGASTGQQQQVSASSSKDQDIGLLASLVVPAIAGVGNQLVTMPLSVIATRMQAARKARAEGRPHKSTSMAAVAKDVYSESGLGGFWAGLVPSLVLISNPTIQYMLYEQLLRLLRAWKRRRLQAQMLAEQQAQASQAGQNGHIVENGHTQAVDGDIRPAGKTELQSLPPITFTAGETFCASALAKVGATLATYWLVVVKSRMQAASKTSSPELQYKGTLDALFRIWQDEGPGGFVKGLRAKILQTALNAALMLMLKEQVYLWTRKVLTSGDLTRQLQNLVKA